MRNIAAVLDYRFEERCIAFVRAAMKRPLAHVAQEMIDEAMAPPTPAPTRRARIRSSAASAGSANSARSAGSAHRMYNGFEGNAPHCPQIPDEQLADLQSELEEKVTYLHGTVFGHVIVTVSKPM